MDNIYAFCTHLSLLAWGILLAYCSPGLFRVVVNVRVRSEDLLSVLLATVAFNYLGYRLVGLLYRTATLYGETELVARSALTLLNILLAIMCIIMIRQYRIRDR